MSDLDVKQIASIANEIVATAKGEDPTAQRYGDFVTCATVALKMDTNQLVNSISQVMNRTIFSYRPYSAIFKGLYKDSIKYGNHTRKLTPLDGEFEEDERLYKANGVVLADGDSVDMYKIAKPKVLQTNFYGFDTWQKHVTVFKDQLDTAFQNEASLGSFLSMVMVNANDQLEQAREELARAALVDLLIGTYKSGESTQQVHLLTEYNKATGLKLNATTVMLPDNYKAFMQWAFSRIATLIDSMRARTCLYHTNPKVNGEQKTIMRHTDKSKMHGYFISEFLNNASNMVESNTFNTEYLSKLDGEKVLYWQSPLQPYVIKAGTTANAMNGETGEIATTTLDADISSVVGILFDTDAMGINLYNQWSSATPFNSAGGYHNIYYHEGARYWVDNTENAIVLCLD